MPLIDPKTNRPFSEAPKPKPKPEPHVVLGEMTPEIEKDLKRRLGQIFHAFGYNFRVTITGPAGMAAEFIGPTKAKRKGKKR